MTTQFFLSYLDSQYVQLQKCVSRPAILNEKSLLNDNRNLCVQIVNDYSIYCHRPKRNFNIHTIAVIHFKFVFSLYINQECHKYGSCFNNLKVSKYMRATFFFSHTKFACRLT